MALLDILLSVDYATRPRALDRVRLRMDEGESVAVLGESGSGKSTLVLAILGLLDAAGACVAGRIRFNGEDLLDVSERRWRALRGKEIAYVPQSAVAALNPALRIGSQMREAWLVHSRGQAREWKEKALALFDRVSLPATEDFLRRFPSQISVGQAQRVLIAMSLLHRPRLLVSDEPTSALDPATRDEIRVLLGDVSREFGIANLLITHDIATAAGLCSRALVLKGGKVLREASMTDLPWQQADAYAQALSSLYAESAGRDLAQLAENLRSESVTAVRR